VVGIGLYGAAMAEAIERSEDGVAVRLHVQPGAGRSEVVGRHGGAIKVRVAAPPERGRANDACAALLADLLGVKPAAVVLASGAASRDKRFTVAGVELGHAQRVLEGASGAAATASHPDKATHRGRRA
jgi:uncharacterized protein (TIGR00251 family)